MKGIKSMKIKILVLLVLLFGFSTGIASAAAPFSCESTPEYAYVTDPPSYVGCLVCFPLPPNMPGPPECHFFHGVSESACENFCSSLRKSVDTGIDKYFEL